MMRKPNLEEDWWKIQMEATEAAERAEKGKEVKATDAATAAAVTAVTVLQFSFNALQKGDAYVLSLQPSQDPAEFRQLFLAALTGDKMREISPVNPGMPATFAASQPTKNEIFHYSLNYRDK